MATWALIPCSRSKLAHPAPARELYWPSALFRGAWRVAELRGERPLILSALHGLVRPDEWLEPYDYTLIGRPQAEREAWARRVLTDLMAIVKPGDRVTSYLGSVYAERIVPALRQQGVEVEEPLRGLRQGERLRWFKEQLHRGEVADGT